VSRLSVEVARHAGVCYGVERALKMAAQAAESGGRVRTLGPLIHNPQAVESLRARGVDVAACLDEVSDGTLVIRTHGVDPAIIRAARDKGLDVVDATCPFVSTAHQVADLLHTEGYCVVIVGEADHPEVEGILAYAGPEALVVEEVADLPAKLPSRRVGVVVQTTQSLARLTAVVDALLPRVSELRVHNTICSATGKRQRSAEDLARDVDVMIVVGGRNSGNTSRLAEICAAVNARTHLVETAEELDLEWFAGASRVGVTGGASTPDEQIHGVIAAVEAMDA
jgi:4-hydroxy-3-methylbut-2-enyl diphosphate reductase